MMPRPSARAAQSTQACDRPSKHAGKLGSVVQHLKLALATAATIRSCSSTEQES
jgi:hypothetical protein